MDMPIFAPTDKLGIPASKDRWWYRFVFFCIVLDMAMIGLGLIFDTNDGPGKPSGLAPPQPAAGQQVHVNQTSLYYVHRWLHLPLAWWGVIWLVFALLIVIPRTRLAGYVLTFILSSLFAAVSLWWILSGHTANWVTSGQSLTSPLIFGAGIRYVRSVELPQKRLSEIVMELE